MSKDIFININSTPGIKYMLCFAYVLSKESSKCQGQAHLANKYVNEIAYLILSSHCDGVLYRNDPLNGISQFEWCLRCNIS